MRVLVTGGAGFIGSNLVDALLDAGDEVVVADDLTTGRRENLEAALARGATLEAVDVTDAPALRAAVGRHRPEVVFHLAAQIDVRRSVEDPAADAAVNVGGTIAVLAAAEAAGARRVVNVSTGGAVYGDATLLPTPESTPPAPLAPYGVGKLAGEQYCSWWARHGALSTVSVRFANVYGPRQDPLGEAGVIAIFCDRALDGRPATVYGDGRQTRDFLFVGDAVDALVRAARVEEPDPSVLNVGSGVETSVLELAEAVGRAAGGTPLELVHEPARGGEVRRSLLDDAVGRRVLGRGLSVGLDEGLELTLRWLRGRPRAGAAGTG